MRDPLVHGSQFIREELEQKLSRLDR